MKHLSEHLVVSIASRIEFKKVLRNTDKHIEIERKRAERVR